MDTYLIKLYIEDRENYVKYIPQIRNFTKEPIGMIKEKILSHIAVIECPFTKKPKQLKELYKLIKMQRVKPTPKRATKKHHLNLSI